MFLYDNSKSNPYHLSVGAMVINQDGLLLLLCRPDGTLEPGETLEKTLSRELMNESGARGDIVSYLGATLMPFRWGGRANSPVYHKAILWHQVALTSIDESLRAQADEESGSSVIWLEPIKAIDIFNRQGFELGDYDFSEAASRLVA